MAAASGLCQCGCGQPATAGRRFIRWHHLSLHWRGPENPAWTNDEVNYQALHQWLMRNGNKTGICQSCKTKPTTNGYRKFGTEWHNISGEYKRVLSDYIELCKVCHIKADRGEICFNQGSHQATQQVETGAIVRLHLAQEM